MIRIINLEKLNKKCIAYRRIHNKQVVYIYLNFSDKEILSKTLKKEPNLIFSTLSNRKALDPRAYNGNLKLTPYEGIIFK